MTKYTEAVFRIDLDDVVLAARLFVHDLAGVARALLAAGQTTHPTHQEHQSTSVHFARCGPAPSRTAIKAQPSAPRYRPAPGVASALVTY